MHIGTVSMGALVTEFFVKLHQFVELLFRGVLHSKFHAEGRVLNLNLLFLLSARVGSQFLKIRYLYQLLSKQSEITFLWFSSRNLLNPILELLSKLEKVICFLYVRLLFRPVFLEIVCLIFLLHLIHLLKFLAIVFSL